jgi:hypothetical protein
MRVHSSTRFAAMAALVGALACAGNTARDSDTDEAAAARDTTTSDTLGQNQPGYRGMERDTAIAPPSEGQPSDTFLQNQGVGGAQDTSGYSGAEQVDTSGQANQGNQQGQMDTTAGAAGDTTSMTRDSAWTPSADTTGYTPSQQPGDSISR